MFSQWLSLHPLAHGAFILLGGIILGYLLHLILLKMMRRGTDKTAEIAESSAFGYIRLPLILTVMAIFADDAVELAGFKQYFWWDELLALLQSLPVLALTWALAALCRSYFARLAHNRKEEANLVHSLALINNLITVLFIFGGCFALFRIWSVDLTPLLASAGLVTAISALAARDALSDFFGGITIFLDRPYHIGDFVVLSTGERGEVVSIGIRSTRMRTRDDIFVSIPNSVMVGAKIVNESSFVPQYRVRCRLGVSYSSDLSTVEKVLLESLAENPYVLDNPEPRVRYRAFGDWSIEVELLAWIRDPRDRGITRDLIIRGIHRASREGKIQIPYPHHEIAVRRDG
jgi:MscS family membrane protein